MEETMEELEKRFLMSGLSTVALITFILIFLGSMFILNGFLFSLHTGTIDIGELLLVAGIVLFAWFWSDLCRLKRKPCE